MMRAVWIAAHGGPETVRVGERPRPVPGPGEALVRVAAASVNPIDWKLRQGLLREIFPLPLPIVLGRDFSGTVAAVGAAVEGLRPGDEVFGIADLRRGGSHAEYLAVDAAQLARKPRGLDHLAAASLPLVGATALAALAETAPIAAGRRILIHAGAGGVGGFAIQYAKQRGAWVAATTSAANRAYVEGLGADRAIDYEAEDFAAALHDLDLVFDTLGGAVHRRSFAVLRPGGTLVHIAAAPIDAPPRGDVAVVAAPVRPTRAVLARIAALADSGAVRPQVTSVLPLAETGQGYELSRGGHVRGKIVIDVAR